MTAPSLGWPAFAAPVLQGVVIAFQRRRKAICYHGRLSCSRELNETAKGNCERLNVDFEGLLRLQLRLGLWEDGMLWLRACLPHPGRNRGWAFLDHFYGHLGGLAPAELVEKFEATILLCSVGGKDDRSERLRELWQVVGPYGE
jgi:hypothetical protein